MSWPFLSDDNNLIRAGGAPLLPLAQMNGIQQPDDGHPYRRRSQSPPIKMLIAHPPNLDSIIPQISISTKSLRESRNNVRPPAAAEFLEIVQKQFKTPLQTDQLKSVAAKLQLQFREKLDGSEICMLPSYNDSLPSGTEEGTYIALDVGGSGLRAGWVQLCGRKAGKTEAVEISRMEDFVIDERVRALRGRSFFDWMAARLVEFLSDSGDFVGRSVSIGLAWSFPVQQESRRDALLLQMGKDFCACDNLIGHNIGDLLEEACHNQGINVRVNAVVNDSAASLLSQMYVDGSTSMAVILGTGLNAAIHLPTTALAPTKFSVSGTATPVHVPPSPNVLVNTELGMFGKDVLATTPWDEVLNKAHARPDFQPLEHLTSGRYLGEIVRLILLKAIQSVNLFDGETPQNLEPYTLATSTLAFLEGDTSYFLFKGGAVFSARHPLPSNRSYSREELAWIREIIILVTSRAAAYMATAIYALLCLKEESEPADENQGAGATAISCLGSIMGKYPAFRDRVQDWLDRLMSSNDDSNPGKGFSRRIQLEMASEGEGTLIGAAVAVAMSEQDESCQY